MRLEPEPVTAYGFDGAWCQSSVRMGCEMTFTQGFISELVGRRATVNDLFVGKVADFLIIHPEETFPPIDGLVIKTARGLRFAPIDTVGGVGKDGTIALTVTPNEPAPSDDERLYLVADLLDKQIVDVDGRKVVRINDIEVDSIRYQQVKYEFTSYSGMQLVMAWFTPDSCDLVLAKLIAAVGAPSDQKSAKGSSAAKTQAMWQLPHGERVVFDGPQGHGFYKGGHDSQTANTMVCIKASQRCVLILSNDVRSEAGFAELVGFILGDTGVPYDWEYGDQAGKS